MIDVEVPQELLGGHVVDRTHDVMRAGQARVGRGQAHQFGQAEVGNLHVVAC